jgi:MFS family permease
MTDRRAGLRNARLLIAHAALRQVLFPMPVFTLFWRRQLGMTLADVMLLQAIFALAITLWELPSGYVADRIGPRRSLLIAGVLWLAGWLLYAIAGSFGAAVVAEVTLGTGLAFASGADSAFLWVSLDAAGRTADYARWEGRAQAAAQTGESVSAVCGGYLYTLAPRLPLWLQVPVAAGWLGVALSLRGTPVAESVPGGHLDRLLRVTRLALGAHARLRTTIALSVALGLASFVLVWLIQPYMEARHVPEVWFGPVWAAANLWVGLVSLASHRVVAALGAETTLLGCCLLVAAGYGLLAATPACYGVGFYLLIMTLRASRSRSSASACRATPRPRIARRCSRSTRWPSGWPSSSVARWSGSCSRGCR